MLNLQNNVQTRLPPAYRRQVRWEYVGGQVYKFKIYETIYE